jgi:hypothetical protein
MSTKKNIDTGLAFSLTNISIIKKYFDQPDIAANKPLHTNIELNLEVRIDRERKQLLDTVHLTVTPSENENIAAGLSVVCVFRIDNFEEVVTIQDESVHIPENILQTLHIISIGTVRGILFSEFRGTWLENAILPIVDPGSFKEIGVR